MAGLRRGLAAGPGGPRPIAAGTLLDLWPLYSAGTPRSVPGATASRRESGGSPLLHPYGAGGTPGHPLPPCVPPHWEATKGEPRELFCG